MTVPPSPHDPYSQPSPAPGPGQNAQPPSQPAPYGQPSPSGSYGQPSPYGPYGQPSPGTGQDAWGGPSAHPSAGPPAAGGPAPASGPAPGVVGPPPGTDLASDLGAALKFAGNALLRNPVSFLVAGLIYSIVTFVLIVGGIITGFVLTIPQMEAAATSETPPLGAIVLMYAIILGAGLLCVPITLLWQSGSGRAAGVVLEGGRPSIGQALVGPMRVILTILLVMVITAVGFVLLYIPGLIATVMLMYSVPAAVRGASPVDAVKESFSLVKNNLGTSIVLLLVLAVIVSVASTLILPYIVLTPFIVLAQFGMYERLSSRALPEPARG